MTKVIMPSELTAENGAKALLMGEFNESVDITCSECYGEGCEECNHEGSHKMIVPVSWTAIKEIYKMAVKHLSEPLSTPEEK